MSCSDHVLVVEDDPSIRQILEDVLRDEGYVVEAVGDGRQALEHLATATPSLVVLDLALPHVDGLAVCRWVRGEPRLSQIPVLMISAYSQPSILEEIEKSGASLFHPKPFDLDLLISQVGYFLASQVSTSQCSHAASSGAVARCLTSADRVLL